MIEGLNLPEVVTLAPRMRQLLLFARAATAKDMGSIFVLNESGNVILDSTTPVPDATNYVDSDFFRAQEQNPKAGLYVSKPWVTSRGEYLIAISRRISKPDGSFFGAVVGTLRLSYFHNIFRKLSIDDAG